MEWECATRSTLLSSQLEQRQTLLYDKRIALDSLGVVGRNMWASQQNKDAQQCQHSGAYTGTQRGAKWRIVDGKRTEDGAGVTREIHFSHQPRNSHKTHALVSIGMLCTARTTVLNSTS